VSPLEETAEPDSTEDALAGTPPPASSPTAEVGARTGECPSFVSGGLGLSRERWEERVGQPVAGSVKREPDTGSGEIVTARYEAPRGTYTAGFLDGILYALSYQLDEDVTLSIEEARTLVRPLLPRDVKPVRKPLIQRGPDGGRVIDEAFSSRSLMVELAHALGEAPGCRMTTRLPGVPVRVDYVLRDRDSVGAIHSEFFAGG
jgi:hypothetical protein